ncbi:MAG: hypothetical protein OEW21_19090 [Betaproteobacteria bacterium]|nr:hypothetical protein [Betaproteobacteria bacterium]
MNDDMSRIDATEGAAGRLPPAWFWVIAIVVLFWYLTDMSAFFMRVWSVDEVVKAMPANQQHLYRDMPLWVNVVFAAEVFGGVLGCIAMLFRRRWALPLFVVSILGVLSQAFHIYFLSDAIDTMGTPAVVMPLVAILIGTLMIVLAKSAIARRWLR